MNNLSKRANILKRDAFDKSVFIYEDHRYILNILFRAFKSNTLTEPVTVIYFDKHDDGRDVSDIDTLKKYRANLPDEREFWSFVEWDLVQNDSDWVKTGMELGLIGDSILIGCKEDSNFSNFENDYTDHLGTDHKIYNVGTIWGGLSHQGWLIDSSQSGKYSPVWNLLGWDCNRPCHFDPSKKSTNFIVDFDLDCFTTQLDKFTIPWPYNEFKKLFNEFHERCFMRSSEFLQKLFKESEFITIARETDYCGSIHNNNVIFDNLNKIVFDNSL